MGKEAKLIYWYSNIVLLFFLCCRFSPISNSFTSSVFSSEVVKYLIIVFNIIIVKYVWSKIENDCRKVSMEIIVNNIIAIIYICSVIVDYAASFRQVIIQMLMSVCLYLICYFIILKFTCRKNLIIFILIALFGTILIGEIQYIDTSKQCNKSKRYSFESRKLYEQCRKLYEKYEETSPYVVLDYTDKSVYVRDLISGKTDYYSFETQKDRENFIQMHTMGVDVQVPRLGTDVVFDDSKYEVSYRLSFSEMDILQKMGETSCIYFSILMVLLMLVSVIGDLYEKNK